MVGLVLVSHSASLAEGTAELARQMGGQDIAIEPAGGLDLPDRPIGTDAVVVMNAIERAWSDDGVVVLMDLGSAVLSTEMAVEMLPDERRALVRLTAAPFVEGAVAAAVAARLGRSLDEVVAEARGGLAAKAAHLEEPAVAPEAGPAASDGEAVTARFVVTNRLGLHARPAARFVTAASGHDAVVRITNLTNGRGPADARSLNAVATLGTLQGHEIEISATGPGANDAIDAIRALAEANFGDDDTAPAADLETPTAPVADAGPDTIAGVAASPGVVVGAVRHLVRPEPEPDSVPAGSPAEERARLDAAIDASADEIRATRTSVASRAGEDAAAIFDAHLLLLRDPELVEGVHAAIDDGRPAAVAWAAGIERAAASWRVLDDPYLRSRADDVEAVGRQVSERLTGGDGRALPSGEGVLVTPDLTPAETASLDPTVVVGVATARGGATSHAAVLARSLGIPAVVALGARVLDLDEGSVVVLDGDRGIVRLRPDEGALADAASRTAAALAAETEARRGASEPAVTRDGVAIHVFANVGRTDDAKAAASAGADGIGLLRTEFLFLGRDSMPGETEQVEAYREIAEAIEGRPVVLRTLDVGGDKPLSYLPMPAEANPFLGVRGLRLSLARPEILRTQLRAAFRVAVDHDVRVMFPMVTTLDEFRAARAIASEVEAELGHTGSVPLGIMVEVPAAALSAPSFAREAAFFSIGTNDLAQYVLAAERGNDGVAPLADALHPAVLRTIAATTSAASAQGLPVAVCGELASDLTAVPVLLGLGVTELSVAPPAVPRVKQAVRGTTMSDAAGLAARALEATSAAEVRALVSG